MAEGGSGGEIAKMFVTIEARIAALEAGLKQAEATTAASGKRMGDNIAAGVQAGNAAAVASTQTATTKMGALHAAGRGGLLDAFGTGIKNATTGIRNAVGAVTAVVGVASRLLGIVGLITSGVYLVSAAAGGIKSALNGGADSAEKMKQKIEDAANVTKRLQQKAKEASAALGIPKINPEALDPNFEDRGKAGRADDRLGLNVVLKDLANATREWNHLQKVRQDAIDAQARGAGDFGVFIQDTKEQMNELAVLIQELERRRADLDSATSRAQANIAKSLIEAFERIIRESMQKQLDSIAFDSARSRQLAEEANAARFRGP